MTADSRLTWQNVVGRGGYDPPASSVSGMEGTPGQGRGTSADLRNYPSGSHRLPQENPGSRRTADAWGAP